MLMRVKDETPYRQGACTDDCDDKPGKYASDWERTLWESYNYRITSEDCDQKRSGPCKSTEDSQV